MIPKTLEAVVEGGGNLRPPEHLELTEQQHVLVTIVTLIQEIIPIDVIQLSADNEPYEH